MAGIFNMACILATSSSMSKPLSASTTSPGSSLLRNPEFTVKSLSLTLPPQVCEIKVVTPSDKNLLNVYIDTMQQLSLLNSHNFASISSPKAIRNCFLKLCPFWHLINHSMRVYITFHKISSIQWLLISPFCRWCLESLNSTSA